MFEKFNEKAIKVMTDAQNEALNLRRIIFSQQWHSKRVVVKTSISFRLSDVVSQFSSIAFSIFFAVKPILSK